MRKQWLALLLALVSVSASLTPATAQDSKERYRNKANDPVAKLPYYKKLRWADGLFRAGSYFSAIEYYQQLLQEQERNPYLIYQLAESYWFTRDYVPAARYYGEAYAVAPKLYPEAVFKQAMMLKMQGEYTEAIGRFEKFIADNPKTYKKLKIKARREIDGANMAMRSVNDPQFVSIVNAGPNVNSAYTELSPVPLGDTALLFSTMRQNSTVIVDRRTRQDYLSRFMLSKKQKDVPQVDSFQWPLEFRDGEFNSPRSHVGNGVFTPGGDRFFFTKCDEGDSLDVMCKIYVSRFEGARWTEGELVGEGVNDDGSNTQPFVARVGKKDVLFFSSNRKIGSRGGYDIYYSIIDPRTGALRRPANAGKSVNTEGNEVTPYYDSRVNKLYFASDGWVTMGGFDIFSADGGPSRYQNLTNLGYPINTSADELYFIKDPVGKPDAYVVSNRIGSIALKNPTCCDDIWRIQYEPQLTASGRAVHARTGALVDNVVIKMTDEAGVQKTYNSPDGNFAFGTPRGHTYVFTGDKPGMTSTRATVNTVNVRRTDPNDSVRITIYMDELTPEYRFGVNNVYYDFDRAEIKSTSMPAIDSLANFLRDNPALTVEIYSHADAKGTNEYNRELSLRRAESVLVALASAGIDRSRMIAKGLGEEQPAAPNTTRGGRDNPRGRALNRRTEFRVVSEDQGRRVIFDSTRPGSPNSQGDNLRIDENSQDESENDSESESGRPGSRVNRDGISQ